jgi:predicted DNA-binding transcriptional regulator AlpA
MADSELISASQFADRLGITVPTLLKKVERKQVPQPLPRSKPSGAGRGKRGGRIQFRKADVDEYLNAKQGKREDLPSELRAEFKELLREVLREEGLA